MSPLATLDRPSALAPVPTEIISADGVDDAVDLRAFEAGAGRRTIDDAELRLFAEWRARRAAR
jgi:hypothetical protein